MNQQDINPYSVMSQAAFTKLNSFRNDGIALFPDSTVCVAISASNRLYCEVSGTMSVNGKIYATHSERDVYKIMCNSNDGTIARLLLMNSNGQPMLPCMDCLQYLVATNNANLGAILTLPDREIYFSEFFSTMAPHTMVGQPNNEPTSQMPSAPIPTVSATPLSVSNHDNHEFINKQTQNANENILRQRLGNIMKGSRDISDDDLPEEAKSKKKRFGLF